MSLSSDTKFSNSEFLLTCRSSVTVYDEELNDNENCILTLLKRDHPLDLILKHEASIFISRSG